MKIKKRYIIIIILIIAGIFIFAFFRRRESKQDKYITAKVERGNLSQLVSATGTIIPPSEIKLNNSLTGKIIEMNVAIGDHVKKGAILSKLDGKDFEIKLKEAEANLSVMQADLNKLLAGAKDEDIAISAVNVEKAKSDYNNSLETLEKIKEQGTQDIKAAEDNIKNVKAKTEKDIEVAEESVKLYKDTLENTEITKIQTIENAKEDAITDVETKMFVAEASLNVVYDILHDSDMSAVISVKDTRYIGQTNNYYNLAQAKIAETRILLSDARSDKSSDKVKNALDEANAALNETFNALLSCYNVLLNTITSADLPKLELDAHKTDIKTEQVAISAALGIIQADKQTIGSAELDYASSFDTAENNLRSAEVNLELAETSQSTKISDAGNNLSSVQISSQKKISDQEALVDSYYNNWKLMERQLDLKKSLPLISEINIYRSRIEQAKAARDSAVENLEKTILQAPTDGIIIDKNYEIGEQTNLNTPIFSMMIINSYEVEVTIPESDIVKLKIGQKTDVTMDAYSDEIEFTGEVIFIEPAETIIQDVVYYKVTIALGETKYEIKSGMTANVDIETAKKENILIIPQRAILGGNGDRYVRRIMGKDVEEMKVRIGLKGEDGMVEVLESDLKEGDMVVVFEKK
ncbi:MAG: efflux RND transporter periplasmic adaptor subunit [bacterium]